MVPGTIPVAVEVDPKQILRILYSESGHNTIFDVEVAGQPAAKAMIVDWQREPIKDKLIHIDLKRIALDKVLRVRVRVKLLGIPIGVKAEGGILDQVLREVEIECLPADIPGHIDVDVSELGMHQVMRVSGLPHSDKIKYLTPEDATVAHVVTHPRGSGCDAGSGGRCGGSGLRQRRVQRVLRLSLKLQEGQGRR
jgi:large subunit ribosomal protein L25